MSGRETKWWVEFEHPGSFVSESSTLDITGPDAKFDVPASAFAYTIWSREDMRVDGKVYRGDPVRHGKRVVFGTAYSVEQVETLHRSGEAGDLGILLSNMRCNKWPQVIRTRRGNWQPLGKNVRVATP